jgi:type IV pilus assembly protein PilF
MTRFIFVCVAALCLFSGCASNNSAKSSADLLRSSEARVALAAEYIKKGELDAAQRALELAFKANPNSAEANLMMAVLLQSEGSSINLNKAERFFKKALRLKKDFAQAHNNYGVYLLERGRVAEAKAHLERAGGALGYSGRAQALENLGRVLVLQKNTPEAKKTFTRALQVDSTLAIARFELANIALNEGNVNIAKNLFSEYMKIVGKDNLRAQALWLGARIANSLGDSVGFEQFANKLYLAYPNSVESGYAQQILSFKQSGR